MTVKTTTSIQHISRKVARYSSLSPLSFLHAKIKQFVDSVLPGSLPNSNESEC